MAICTANAAITLSAVIAVDAVITFSRVSALTAIVKSLTHIAITALYTAITYTTIIAVVAIYRLMIVLHPLTIFAKKNNFTFYIDSLIVNFFEALLILLL